MHDSLVKFGHPSHNLALNATFIFSSQDLEETCDKGKLKVNKAVSKLCIDYSYNSRCCLFKTPPTTGQNLCLFLTRTILEINKVVCKKTLSETHASWCCKKLVHLASVCCANRIAVKFRGRIVRQSFFWKQLGLFLRHSAGKKISGFCPVVGGASN